MKKKIIRCPNCEEKGIKQNMAEVLESGFICIQRFHHKDYGKDYTLVGGTDFYLVCGNCKQKVFVRQQ